MDFIYEYTEDNLRLPATYFESREKDICVVFIHGMYTNILENYFAVEWGKLLAQNNIGFLYGHTRGYSSTNDIITKSENSVTLGTTFEIFENCLKDIKMWIKKAYELGYKRIVLAGHSFGSNKVLYYYYKNHPDIIGIIFASPPDMQGLTRMYEPNYDSLLKETEKNIREGQPRKLTSKLVENYLPFSSATFQNFYKPGSNVDNFPITRNPEHFKQLETVEVPILAFSGANEEEPFLQLDLLKQKAKKCSDFTYKIISNTNHIYWKKEKETGMLILNWLKNLKYNLK
ncbi:alpha/beta fold hydrolase [Lactobacillus agrestimuris]|uniref:alpha/beta hydrolase n=1 Tax=Lactobacillus agrestimuris TaxID=2941328 RepID=UPI002042E14A|nr:alpha/beta fold hydrolase [Lactobacillus agrestimuris]